MCYNAYADGKAATRIKFLCENTDFRRKMKLFSVTVPCYNSEGYMRKCIESLLKGGEETEIIIIDDGSKDGTGKIADEYAERYPSIVKVVHQENGGHGEGINQGILRATGKYFMVVDSDDYLEETALKTVLNEMRELEKTGGTDLIITDYVYDHDDISLNHVISYAKVFKNGKATRWEETGKFRTGTYLTLHSLIYSVEVLRKSGIVLPKHTFYEDNYFSFYPLKWVDKFKYIGVSLYYYYIGRDGQSVQSDVWAKRYAMQVNVSVMVFKGFNLKEELKKNKKRGKYFYHNALMLMSLATAAARLNGTEEAEKARLKMWQDCREHDKKLARKMLHFTPIAFQSMPGKGGRAFANFLYRTARRLVKN